MGPGYLPAKLEPDHGAGWLAQPENDRNSRAIHEFRPMTFELYDGGGRLDGLRSIERQ